MGSVKRSSIDLSLQHTCDHVAIEWNIKSNTIKVELLCTKFDMSYTFYNNKI